MKSNAKSVDEYLAGLADDRRLVLTAVREMILKNLPTGYQECIQYGMIAYVVPHSLYPAGYHCDPRQPLLYAALASQKNHMALYLCTVYGDPATRDWFCKEYKAAGKKLDMGKSCVRFKKLDDLPLGVIGRLIARTPVRNYVAYVEKTLLERKAAKPRARK